MLLMCNQVEIGANKLEVSLDWFGSVISGKLAHCIKQSEATWTLDAAEMTIILPKSNRRDVWRSLYEGDSLRAGQ
jgi:hypothetical protein